MKTLAKIAVFLAGFGAFSQAGLALCSTFPQSVPFLPSPNSRLVLNNEDSDTEPHHRLMLLKVGSKDGRRKVLDYGRSIDVCWSPDSHWLMVIDHEGSDSTRPYIFSASDSTVKVDIKQWLVEHNPSKQLAEADRAHLYVTAEWKDKSSISVSAAGYDDTGHNGKVNTKITLRWKDGQLSFQQRSRTHR